MLMYIPYLWAVLNPNIDNLCILVDGFENLLYPISDGHLATVFVRKFSLLVLHFPPSILCHLDR